MMHRNVKLFALLLLLLTGCAGPETAAAGTQSESIAGDRPHAMAGVPSEDCLLCNGLDGTRYSYCWGQDNLALLSLNTGEIWPLEINRYELGELIEEYAGHLSMLTFMSADGGFQLGDYYYVADSGVDGARDFLAFYCPERYPK